MVVTTQEWTVSAFVVLSLVLLLIKRRCAPYLEFLRRQKEYEFSYCLLTGLIWCAIYVNGRYMTYERESYDAFMDGCCGNDIGKYRKETISRLNNSLHILSNSLNKNLIILGYSIKKLEPLQNFTRKVSDGLDIAAFENKTNSYRNKLTDSHRHAASFDNFLSHAIIFSRGSRCESELSKPNNTFDIAQTVVEIYQTMKSVGNDKFAEISRKIEIVGKVDYGNHTGELIASIRQTTTRMASNIESLKNRVNTSLTLVTDAASVPAVKSKDVNWVHYAHIFFYVSLTVIAFCSTFPIAIPVVTDRLEMFFANVEKVAFAGFIFTIAMLAIICSMFIGLSQSGVVVPFEQCTQNARTALQSPFDLRLVDNDFKVVELSNSSCQSPTESYMSHLDVAKFFPNAAEIQSVDFHGYQQGIITAVNATDMPTIDFLQSFNASTMKLAHAVDSLDEWIEDSCSTGNDAGNLKMYRDKFNALLTDSKEYLSLLVHIFIWKERALTVLDNAVRPVKKNFETLVNDTLEKVKGADFQCQKMLNIPTTCQRPEERPHCEFYVCLLAFFGFVAVANQFFLCPWTLQEEEFEGEDISDLPPGLVWTPKSTTKNE